MKEMTTIISVDGEYNGLGGQLFAFVAIAYNADGNEIDRFVGRCPIQEEVDPWVTQNVLPRIQHIVENYDDLAYMLQAFARFYLRHWTYQHAEVIAHLPAMAEGPTFTRMLRSGMLTFEQLPHPLQDVSHYIGIADSNPRMSLQSYIQWHRLQSQVPSFEDQHNPEQDAINAAAVWFHVQQRLRRMCVQAVNSA